MKAKTQLLPSLAATFIAALALSSCDKHDHDKEGRHHDEEGNNHAEEGHQHAEEGHQHHEDDHAHAKKAGPNGGRVLTNVEPHAEFFVTDNRKVRITFVDDDFKPIAAGAQVISVIAGDRQNPVNLSFATEGNSLISDKPLPEGKDFPVVVMIKADKESDEVTAKFQCNLHDCPTCDYKEYACTCDH
jgi:hypothetical protein